MFLLNTKTLPRRPATHARDVEPTAETVGAIVCASYRILSPGCRAVELSRLRRAAVEVLSRPCLSSLSSSCRVAVEPVEASRD